MILVVAVAAIAFLASPARAELCTASVYTTHDHDQNGTVTASGIPLDDSKPTVAHNTAPLKSRIRVVNRDNGLSAAFVVTDRGPHVRGRCVDLSRAAAIILGCNGLCPVKVE